MMTFMRGHICFFYGQIMTIFILSQTLMHSEVRSCSLCVPILQIGPKDCCVYLHFLTFRHNIACKQKFVSSCVRDEYLWLV